MEAEQSVLGAMLIDSRCVPDIIGILKPEDFFLRQNREIYETIYTMFNFSQVIDPVTVLTAMQERGVDASTDYLKQLMEITPTAANVVRYANIVRDKAMLRALATAAGRSPRQSTRGWAPRRKFWNRRKKRSSPAERGAGRQYGAHWYGAP